MRKRTPWLPEKRGTDDVSFREEFPWFSIAYLHKKLGVSVMITRNWASFSKEYERLTQSGVKFKVWCGSYDDVEKFRQECQALQPHEDP